MMEADEETEALIGPAAARRSGRVCFLCAPAPMAARQHGSTVARRPTKPAECETVILKLPHLIDTCPRSHGKHEGEAGAERLR